MLKIVTLMHCSKQARFNTYITEHIKKYVIENCIEIICEICAYIKSIAVIASFSLFANMNVFYTYHRLKAMEPQHGERVGMVDCVSLYGFALSCPCKGCD